MWKGAVRGTRTLLSVQTILPMMNGQGPKALPYRFDGVTSLAVLVGEAGVAPGVRILDPIIGLAITFEETVGVYGTDRLRSSWT